MGCRYRWCRSARAASRPLVEHSTVELRRTEHGLGSSSHTERHSAHFPDSSEFHTFYSCESGFGFAPPRCGCSRFQRRRNTAKRQSPAAITLMWSRPRRPDTVMAHRIGHPQTAMDSMLASHGRGWVADLFFEPPEFLELSAERDTMASFVFMEAFAVRPGPDPMDPRGYTVAVWFQHPRGGTRIVWSSHGWSGHEMLLHQDGQDLRGVLRPFSDVYSEPRDRAVLLKRVTCEQ